MVNRKHLIKTNIHNKSIKSKIFTTKKKEISPSFSFSNLIANRSKFNDKEAQNISQAFALLKSTKIIKLDFKNSKEMTDQGLLWIAEGLRKLSSVHTVIINLTGCDQITERGINNLTQGIKRQKFIKKFHLNLQGCSQIGDEGLQRLRANLRGLAFLGFVKMNFSGCYHISDMGIEIIFASLGRSSSVRSIDMKYSFLGNLTNSTGRRTTRGLKKFPFLENLSLRYKKCGGIGSDGNQGIKDFTQIFKTTTDLKRINLALEKCGYIGDLGLNYLCEALSTINSLQIIQINFASCDPVTGEGLKAIQNLSKNSQLKEISLNFSG